VVGGFVGCGVGSDLVDVVAENVFAHVCIPIGEGDMLPNSPLLRACPVSKWAPTWAFGISENRVCMAVSHFRYPLGSVANLHVGSVGFTPEVL